MSSTLPTSPGVGILPALIGGSRLGDAARRTRALLNRSSLKTVRPERNDGGHGQGNHPSPHRADHRGLERH